MAGQFGLQGLGEVLKALGQSESELVERVKPVVQRHTQAMLSKAQADVPVDEGTLKSSLKAEVATGDGWVFGRVVATDQKAHLVEYGTVNTTEQPFLTPAYESEKSRFEADVRKALEK